jgi:4-amino-4-deoxy-L-arabinose transferase-like glycosyltransferase
MTMRRFPSWFRPSWFSVGVLAVVVHAALLLVVIPQVGARVNPLYNQDRFSDGYDQLAQNLVLGNGYRFYPDTARTLMREPGYPVFLAGIMLLFGSSFLAVKIANLLLALATAWLMIRLAARLSDNRWLGIAAALLFLFHPATLIAESRGSVETLFTFLVVLFLLVLHIALGRSDDWRYYLLTGAVLGLTVLVRSTPMLFPVFLLGYLLVLERHRTPPLAICRNVAVVVLAMFAVLSPWIIRNYGLTRKFVPTASVLGISAHAGEYICAHRSEDRPFYLLDRDAAQERTRVAAALGYPIEDGYYYQSFYSTEHELKFSGYLAHQVFRDYARNPLFCAKCMALNVFNFWFTGKTAASTAANVLVQLPYLILAGFGVLLSVRRKQFALIGPMVLFIVYVMAVHVPILAQARYSVPLIPLLSILASVTLISKSKPANLTSAAAGFDGAESSAPVPSLVGSGTEKQ